MFQLTKWHLRLKMLHDKKLFLFILVMGKLLSHLFKQKSKADFIRKLPIKLNNQQNFITFLLKLKNINKDAVIFKVGPPFNLKFKSQKNFLKVSEKYSKKNLQPKIGKN